MSERDSARSEAARMLASFRKRHRKACPVCGQEFVGIANRIYDRPACQTRAYRMRRLNQAQNVR